MNRLSQEDSPYLLQHAENPVDWYPWGDMAFQKAKVEDKVVFLSIGYSSCHWCHVMEQESFENQEIAAILNESFISIKVDREELPEVDSQYMEFAQSLMGGQAGWPLNLFLTPDLHPIFATTYLPPKNQEGLMGFQTLLQNIAEIWASEEREKISEEAEKLVELFQKKIQSTGSHVTEQEWLNKGLDEIFRLSDPLHGGLLGSPKFPITPQLFYLSHHVKRTGDSRALFLVEKTLTGMAYGGIFDQLGGGFHRYSIDEEWFHPHFEKMGSDNALLTEIYLLGYLLTQNPLYKQVALLTQRFMLEEMSSKDGLFYTAQDADSEGVEGKYYLWSKEEVDKLLGNESTLFCDVYSLIEEGNFEAGKNILFLQNNFDDIADDKHLSKESLELRIANSRKILFAARALRIPPFRDEKVLVGNNALEIAALVRMGQILNDNLSFGFFSPLDRVKAPGIDDQQSEHIRKYEPIADRRSAGAFTLVQRAKKPKTQVDRFYFEKALAPARYIKDNLWNGMRLFRKAPLKDRKFYATLDEYAALIRALLLLVEADLGIEWFHFAIDLTEQLFERFKVENGAFLATDSEEPHLLLRKPIFLDGTEPSGNAIMCQNLMKLYRLTGHQPYLAAAKDILKAVQPHLEGYPSAHALHMLNLEESYDQELPSLFLALSEGEENLSAYKEVLWKKAPFLGSLFFIHPELRSLPHCSPYPLKDSETTLYICSAKGCRPPITGKDAILSALQGL